MLPENKCKKDMNHTLFALWPKPIKMLSDFISRCRRPWECIYSTMIILVKWQSYWRQIRKKHF